MVNGVISNYMKGRFSPQPPVLIQSNIDTMYVLVLSTLCVFLFSFSQCSSIITRSMIRMPEKFSNSFPGTQTVENPLPEPSKLVLPPENTKYQIIYPLKQEEPIQSRSLAIEQEPSQMKISNLQFDSEGDLKTNFSSHHSHMKHINSEKWKEKPLENAEQKIATIQESYGGENTPKSFSTNLSSKEISSKYWGQYQNFSFDLFNNTNDPVNKPVVLKQFQGVNVWEMFQSLYKCVWASGLLACLQTGFGDVASNASTDTFSYLQFLVPRLPRVQPFNDPVEEFTNRNDEFPATAPDNDEGRRRLSKKLQIILPILMFLKMSMLPALAVMALVTGKAFLMSLLSLGVALIAATMQSPFPRADKRHEISPQSPLHNDHAPNGYYYMM